MPWPLAEIPRASSPYSPNATVLASTPCLTGIRLDFRDPPLTSARDLTGVGARATLNRPAHLSLLMHARKHCRGGRIHASWLAPTRLFLLGSAELIMAFIVVTLGNMRRRKGYQAEQILLPRCL